MKLTISGYQHVDTTDTLREYVQRKLTRTDRHFGLVIQSHVVLQVTRIRHRVETTIHTRGTQWHATTEDNDMYAAIDRVVDKLDRQTTKHKEKVVDHHQQGGGLKKRPKT